MEIDKNFRPTKKLPQECFCQCPFGHSSLCSWQQNPLAFGTGGGFFPSQSKGSKAAAILYPAACNNTKGQPRAHLRTVCTYTQHRQETHGQPQINAGRERCLYRLLCQHRLRSAVTAPASSFPPAGLAWSSPAGCAPTCSMGLWQLL